MIFDMLERSRRLTGGMPDLAPAFTFLSTRDLTHAAPGRIDLEGEALFAIVQEYTTRPLEQGTWEAHRRYIDVQYLVAGRERILFAPLEQMKVGVYVPEKDFLPMTGDGSSLYLSAGFFAVFFPEDAHMPGLEVNSPASVKKVVVKIRIPGM